MMSFVTLSHLMCATTLFRLSRVMLNGEDIRFDLLAKPEKPVFAPCGWCGSTCGTNEENGYQVDDWPRCMSCQGC